MTEIKRMDIKEFREIGYLQEANRLFFHPLGLALEVIIDDKTGVENLGGVWDFRDDPEGLAFRDGEIEPEKSERIMNQWRSKALARGERLGFVIQPAKRFV